MDAVIEVLVRDVGPRTVLNLQEKVRDAVSGEGLKIDHVESFTPAAAVQTELAGVASGAARIRVYSA